MRRVNNSIFFILSSAIIIIFIYSFFFSNKNFFVFIENLERIATLESNNILKREVTLNHPYPFDLGVIWSNPPRKMICLEPWTSPRNSLVDGLRKIL